MPARPWRSCARRHPRELSGNLRGMEQVLRNFENGNNPVQAVEGKMTGLTNQCRGLANR